ncbi:hypothetical protein DCS_06019 [Drechmeria coniospora]|uniref:Uncharacterized protein n=1 Tax=Drechmeria coniospora TaxID=98403 RepID=A0A151GAE2_DRECN|nr:hypothetical protein DCS_06019 [Drechmeria coniospora]KYK54063.1 hypothetical protein DCS_06019 [Drechmeria coniospora]
MVPTNSGVGTVNLPFHRTGQSFGRRRASCLVVGDIQPVPNGSPCVGLFEEKTRANDASKGAPTPDRPRDASSSWSKAHQVTSSAAGNPKTRAPM